MSELRAHGIAILSPPGWEGRIFRRAEFGEVNVEVVGAAAPEGERSFPVVHVATIPLPLDVADYGSDVVEDLGRNDALIILKEFDPASVGQPLFARKGMPRTLRPESFDPAVLQRRLDGQAGFQEFFQEAGRAFCLYVVLGSYAPASGHGPQGQRSTREHRDRPRGPHGHLSVRAGIVQQHNQHHELSGADHRSFGAVVVLNHDVVAGRRTGRHAMTRVRAPRTLGSMP